VAAAVSLNPLGLPAFGGMVVVPFWLLYDWIWNSDSLLRALARWDAWLKRRMWTLAFLLALVCANWIWNISKGL
jgi:hypothetical protein